MKAFADDLTIISSKLNDHQTALLQIDSCCSDLDLHLKPDKCITLSFSGKKFDSRAVVKLKQGLTINASQQPAKLLGRFISTNRSSSSRPSTTLCSKFKAALSNLNKRPIRGEYKVWVYHHYLAPSIHFHLAVNVFAQTTLKKLEALATKMHRKWLNLPRNATRSRAILYHPKVLNCPQVTFMYKKASLDYLIAIEGSTDHVIKELQPMLDSQSTQHNLGLPSDCFDLLEAGRHSVSTIPALKRHCKQGIANLQESHWNHHLNTLSVQCKFSNVVSLESEQHVWSKLIRGGLPHGQLSFLLKAGSDTLPTALNLKRMRIQCDGSCKLCRNPRPTTAHILSGCPEALSQGRYTWRHDSVLKCICKSLLDKIHNVKLYADLCGYRFDDSPPLTIPSSIVVTSYRPDLVIVSETDKRISILELTVPNNTPDGLINARHRKQHKQEYLSLAEDISRSDWTVTYDTIEIGSLGHYSKDSLESIKSVLPSLLLNSRQASLEAKDIIHSACKVAMLCSRYIFLAHKCISWNSDKPLL